MKGLGGGALTGGVGGIFSGVSNGLGNFAHGAPGFFIDGFGNMATNAVAKSMGFASKSHADAFAHGFQSSMLRAYVRAVSGVYSGAEFGRSRYNTVGVAHKDTDIYRSLAKDSENNAIALAYRSRADDAGADTSRWYYEGQEISNAGPIFNNLSQVHDGFNAFMSAHGQNQWLDNGLLNIATMVPTGAAAQHLDQSSFWNTYETYR